MPSALLVLSELALSAVEWVEGCSMGVGLPPGKGGVRSPGAQFAETLAHPDLYGLLLE
jgi:hypothetical protein